MYNTWWPGQGVEVVNEDDFKVSVAMCTFNGAAFVEAQLESILAQSRSPDEIIVCDDRSTDGTVDLAAKIAQKYPAKIRIIRNERRLGYRRNFESAVSLATGDVIFLSDQDDFWFPDKVASMLRVFAEDPEVVVAYSDAVLTDGELRPTGTMFNRRKDIDLRKTPALRQLSRGVAFNGPMMAFHSRLRPFVIPFSPLSLQWGHDHWIGFIAYAVGKIGVINRPLVYYRRHGTNSGGDAELDGGLLYQWRVVKKKYTGSEEYGERRRGWEDMVTRLHEIRNSGLPLSNPAKLDELLQVSELCLQFAKARQMHKTRGRFARTPSALRLLFAGDYHRYARGFKTFVQDLVIP
jgi:glycosyltransferase involved in cell wall biosynthesis